MIGKWVTYTAAWTVYHAIASRYGYASTKPGLLVPIEDLEFAKVRSDGTEARVWNSQDGWYASNGTTQGCYDSLAQALQAMGETIDPS